MIAIVVIFALIGLFVLIIQGNIEFPINEIFKGIVPKANGIVISGDDFGTFCLVVFVSVVIALIVMGVIDHYRADNQAYQIAQYLKQCAELQKQDEISRKLINIRYRRS